VYTLPFWAIARGNRGMYLGVPCQEIITFLRSHERAFVNIIKEVESVMFILSSIVRIGTAQGCNTYPT
jgi:hypothetical protein